MSDVLINQAEALMKKTVEKVSSEFVTIRTGRATPALIENIKVECYNTTKPLKQVAGISIPDAKTIEIRPWDVSVIGSIEKSIYQSSIGITPVNDGKVIRLTIPPLTEEHRQELVKYVCKLAEEFRASIRNDRRQIHELIKKNEKEKKITEDQKYKFEDKLQKVTDSYIKKVDELLAIKKKEILTE